MVFNGENLRVADDSGYPYREKRKTYRIRVKPDTCHVFLVICFCLCTSVLHRVEAQRVVWHDLPAAVVESFDLAHPKSGMKMVHWELADRGYCARINLPSREISTLFQANGEWVSTRWVIPESQLPLKAHDFISEKYAFYELRSCKYEEDHWEGRHYYVLLSIYGIEGYMTEVCFDLSGNVVSIDGNTIEDLDDFEPLTEEDVLLKRENELLARREEQGRADTSAEGQEMKRRASVGFFTGSGRAKKRLPEAEDVGREEGLREVFRDSAAGGEERLRPEASGTELAEDIRLDSLQQEKEKQRQKKRLYRPQSRRAYIEAQVMVQSKTARQRDKEYRSGNGLAIQDTAMLRMPSERTESAWVDALPADSLSVEVVSADSVLAETVRTDSVSVIARTPSWTSSMQGGQAPKVEMSVKTVFPATVQQAFDRRFPRAENVKYYRDTSGLYRAVFQNFGQKAEAVLLPDGTHMTTALFFGKKEMSYPILQYMENAPEKYRFEVGKRVVYESRYRQRFPAAEKPKNYYQIVVWVKDKATRGRKYFLLTFDQKAHFVSSSPYDYVGSR